MRFASSRPNQRSIVEAPMSIEGPRRDALRVAIALVVGATVFSGAFLLDWRPPPLPVSMATIAPGEPSADCAALLRIGQPSEPHEISTDQGLRVMVRTPINYESDRPYPLIVVYPPAQFDRFSSERFYNMTTEATRRGMIVAYSDYKPLSVRAVALQAAVAASVAARFCIDVSRITYFGHSDGGAMAEGIPGMVPTTLRPHVIVASGAGITNEDLSHGHCVAEVNVMIIHNRDDAKFRDFGRGTAAYWAQCAACRPRDLSARDIACQKFEGCAHGIAVMYCHVDELHEKWPGIEGPALDFIESANQQIPRGGSTTSRPQVSDDPQ